jgi:hypothetical protein
MNFIIKDREIYYSDKKWGNWIRCLPPPENFLKIIALSRNRIPATISNLFVFTEEEMKEYQAAKDEEELAQIIIKDAKSKGCILIKKSDSED